MAVGTAVVGGLGPAGFISVRIEPGLIALTSIPDSWISLDRVEVNAFTAALELE